MASGGKGAHRAEVGDPEAQQHLDELLEQGDVLVQQYVTAVESEGEWSIVLVDGVVGHGLRKWPAAGDYRVHEEWGGTTERVEPSAGLVELATRVCAILPAPALYARVDIVSINGSWHVMEVEATEPSLWLDLAPATARVAGRRDRRAAYHRARRRSGGPDCEAAPYA